MKSSMLTKSLFILLFGLNWAIIVTSKLSESSWADLEIVDKIVTGIYYHGSIVDIYELKRSLNRLDGKKTYGYTPVVELEHGSARCRFNDLTGHFEVVFSISFWSSRLQRFVVKYLRNEVSSEIKNSDVSVLHFDQIMLTSSLLTSELYTLKPQWDNYAKKPSVYFKMFSPTRSKCQRVVDLMHSRPDLFDHFRMQFSVSPKTSRTETVKITADTLRQGQFLDQLIQQISTSGSILLTSQDASNLVTETVANVAAAIIDDPGLISPKSAIYQDLSRLFVSSIHSSSDVELWASVFWNPLHKRPDQLSQTVIEIHKMLNDQDRDYLTNYFTSTEQGAERNPFHLKSLQEDQLKILDEAKDHVEWREDVKNFQPKVVQLSRIELPNILNKTLLAGLETSLTYVTVGLSMNVAIRENMTDNQLNILTSQVDKLKQWTDERFHSLNAKMADREKVYKEQLENLTAQIRALEVSNVIQQEASKALTVQMQTLDQNVTEKLVNLVSNTTVKVACRDTQTPWRETSNDLVVGCGPNEFLSRFKPQAESRSIRRQTNSYSSWGFVEQLSYVYRCCSVSTKPLTSD